MTVRFWAPTMILYEPPTIELVSGDSMMVIARLRGAHRGLWSARIVWEVDRRDAAIVKAELDTHPLEEALHRLYLMGYTASRDLTSSTGWSYLKNTRACE